VVVTVSPGVLTESVVEQAALAWLTSADSQVRNDSEIPLGEPAAERVDHGEELLGLRPRDPIAWLNPALPRETLDAALRLLTRPEVAGGIPWDRALILLAQEAWK
jgi:hypothetical protein